MKKLISLSIKSLVLVLTLLLVALPALVVQAISPSGDSSYVERTDDGIKINGATFRTTGRNATEDLSFGVKYYNDSIMVSTTLTERMTEYALGGSSYGTVPFVKGQEYSGSAFVLEVPVDTGVEVVPWQVVRNGVWQLATVKTIAEDFESHYPEYKVLAAVNGSFFDINATSNYSHTSSGAIACFGENYKLTNNGAQLGFTNDGTTNSIVEQDSTDKSATPVLSVYDKDGAIIYTANVNKTNTEPEDGEISVYYGLYDELHKCIGIDVKDAFVVASSNTYSVAYSSNTFYGKGEITAKGDAKLSTNQFAIVSKNADVTAKLSVGTTIRVQYESTNIRNGADNTIYYVDRLVHEGKSQDEVANAGVLSGYSQYRYPRTLLGKKTDGTIVMTCTDGRQASKGLYGLNGTESAAEMMYYGCDEAWCFDGGGSTSMCVLLNGELTYVNSPSDGSQRSDGNAMLVVVKVPTVEVSNKSNQDSLTFNVDVIKSVEKYSDLYIGIGETKKKIVANQDITFEGLETYKEYNYKLYAKVGENYLDLPYAGIVSTAKHNFVFQGLTMKVDGDNYKVFYDIEDVDTSINTVVMVVNGKRFTARSGVITVPKENGGPLTGECKIIITYDLKDLGTKENVQSQEFATTAALMDSEIAFQSVVDEVGCLLGNLFK